METLLGAVHDEHGSDRKGRDAEGAQPKQPAPQLVARHVAQSKTGETAESQGAGLSSPVAWRRPPSANSLPSSFLINVMRPMMTVSPPAASRIGRMVVLHTALLCSQTPISTVGKRMVTTPSTADEHRQGAAGLLAPAEEKQHTGGEKRQGDPQFGAGGPVASHRRGLGRHDGTGVLRPHWPLQWKRLCSWSSLLCSE